MQTITFYKADDGTTFESPEKCLEHERLCREISEIMSRLPEVEVHGSDSVQLDSVAVLSVQRDLMKIFDRLHPTLVDQQTQWAHTARQPAGMTIVGRYIDDAGPAPLRRAWGRMCCIDNQFREYEQPYYALQANRRSG